MQFSGVVQKVFSKPFAGKTLHSFALRDLQGTYFNLGDKQAPAEGSQITFEAKQGTKPNAFTVFAETIKVGADAPVDNYKAPFAQRTGGATRSAGVMTKDNYWENREARDVETQKRIQLQASRNTAIALATLAHTVEKFKTREDMINFMHEWVDDFLNNPVAEQVVDSPEAAAPAVGNWS